MSALLLPLAAENPLIPEPAEIIASICFALILTVVIWKFVVPRFEQTYAERTAAIQGGIEKAEHAQAEAAAALEKYNAQLAEARGEAAKIREDAKTQGSQILADMREQAQAEAARIRAAASTPVKAQTEKSMGARFCSSSRASSMVAESLPPDSATATRSPSRIIL